jgi:hypothetical protein
MTPEHPVEPRRSHPGQRALGAMEVAVRRARASQGVPIPPVGSGAPPTPATAVPPNKSLLPRVDDDSAEKRSERRLVAAVAVAAVLVVASGIALAVSAGHGSGGPSPTAASTTHSGPTGVTTTTNRTATTTTTGANTTTTGPSAPGTPPQISTVTPASGSPGQTVTITGSSFLSPDGRIVAFFNGQVTATSCPSQDTCTVTVPPASAGETTALVTVMTGSGTSNPVAFSYG